MRHELQNDVHVLKKGAASVKKWQTEHLGVHSMLLDIADLRGFNISNMVFSQATFRCSDLRGADLTCSLFHGCNFIDTDLRGCNLRDTVFESCDFRKARMHILDMEPALFLSCRGNGRQLVSITAGEWSFSIDGHDVSIGSMDDHAPRTAGFNLKYLKGSTNVLEAVKRIRSKEKEMVSEIKLLDDILMKGAWN